MTDAERLDWLERTRAEVQARRILGGNKPGECLWLVTVDGHRPTCAPTLREAIDRAAALSGE